MDNIIMNDLDKKDSSFSEQGLKPKGKPIDGIDYGIDLLTNDEKPQPSSPPPPSLPPFKPEKTEHYAPSSPPALQGHPIEFQEFQGGSLYSKSQTFDLPSRPTENYMGEGRFQSFDMQPPSPSPTKQQSLYDSENSGFRSSQPPELTYEQKRSRKIDALAALARLESQGYVPAGKKGSHTTELHELEAMVDKLTAQRDLDSSIKFQRKILIGFATIMEKVCDDENLNIFDLNLDGWSESIYENITEYDDVFEKLYLKYKNMVSIPPELELITTVAGSAWMFHMSRNMFGKASTKVPGFDDVMKHDPELKRHYKKVATQLAQKNGLPVPDKKKDAGNMNFIGQVLGLNKDVDMNVPPKMPQNPQRTVSPQSQNAQSQNSQNSQNSQSSQSKRVPMEEPYDIDGLLQGFINNEEEEIDLSELENLSDLDKYDQDV